MQQRIGTVIRAYEEQGWHRTGWLIETEKKNGILPPSPALVEWHDKLKATRG